MSKYHFFLGGKDLEMLEIRKILEEHNIPFSDKGLDWGAAASAYGDEIAQVADQGFIPVLVELKVDIDLPEGTKDVNHHDDRSDEPAAILQVVELLQMSPSRWQQLVAINDVNFSHGLLEFGATHTEIALVRAADRKAQGITDEQERQAEEAFKQLQVEVVNGIHVGIADNVPHDRFAPIQDFAFLAGNVDLLICIYRENGEHEINFYWYPELCKVLGEANPYPKSYFGYQFWGSTELDPDEMKQFILNWLSENGKPEGVVQPSPRK